MKAHLTDPDLIIDSVMVSFSFQKDESKRDAALCLVEKKQLGRKVSPTKHFTGEEAIELYKTLTGKDPYENGQNHS